jgi:cellulose biosynthesis protein BcsQ
MKPAILAVVNGKGGCGKTSCVSNLTVIWSTQARRVLALDLDAQGNLAVDGAALDGTARTPGRFRDSWASPEIVEGF